MIWAASILARHLMPALLRNLRRFALRVPRLCRLQQPGQGRRLFQDELGLQQGPGFTEGLRLLEQERVLRAIPSSRLKLPPSRLSRYDSAAINIRLRRRTVFRGRSGALCSGRCPLHPRPDWGAKQSGTPVKWE